MNEEQIQAWKDKLDKMSQLELGRLQRFAPSGHPVFRSDLPIYDHFKKVFKGMTPSLSKELGW